MTNRLALLLVIGLPLTGTAWAQTPKDNPVIRELRAKATAGDANAQNNLGFLYADGRGVPKDDALAVAWYRKAAEQGHAGAQYNLNTMYAYGRGVTKDNTAAVAWLRKAAEQGHTTAQLNLGVRYQNGLGVPKDDILAYMWLHLGVSRSSGSLPDIEAKMRDDISSKLTPKQRADAQRIIREWQAAFEKRKK